MRLCPPLASRKDINYVNEPPTFCVIRKIEGGVKIVDPATSVDSLVVIHVVRILAGRGPEDKHNVIIPNNRELFRAGRSLAPKGNLSEPWGFDHQRVEDRVNRNPPPAARSVSRAGG